MAELQFPSFFALPFLIDLPNFLKGLLIFFQIPNNSISYNNGNILITEGIAIGVDDYPLIGFIVWFVGVGIFCYFVGDLVEDMLDVLLE